MSGFVLIDGVPHRLSLSADGAGGYRIGAMPSPLPAAITARDGDRLWVHLDGRAWEMSWADAVHHLGEEGDAGGGDVARAPMPGAVIAVDVQPGDVVAAGDRMLIIESMKLETAIRAPRDGVVAAVPVTVGQTFDLDAVLVQLEEIA